IVAFFSTLFYAVTTSGQRAVGGAVVAGRAVGRAEIAGFAQTLDAVAADVVLTSSATRAVDRTVVGQTRIALLTSVDHAITTVRSLTASAAIARHGVAVVTVFGADLTWLAGAIGIADSAVGVRRSTRTSAASAGTDPTVGITQGLV